MSAADEKLQDMTAPTAACGSEAPLPGFQTALDMKKKDKAAEYGAAQNWYALVRAMANQQPLKVSRLVRLARQEAGLPLHTVTELSRTEAVKETFHDIPDYGSPEATQEWHDHANYAPTVPAYKTPEASFESDDELIF